MLYLFVPLGRGQGAVQIVQVSSEAAALRLQPVPVEDQCCRAGLLLLQAVREVRQLALQLPPGLLQLGAALLGRLDVLLLLRPDKHRFRPGIIQA